MSAQTPIYSIIMAGGKGRRMRNSVFHKVCFQVAGIPAIHRALDAYNRLGVVRNVVVVGELAGQVVETVGRKFRNAVFAYQPQALGTGDAARCGLHALADVPDDARILVVAGDKILANAVLARLVEDYRRADADLAVLASPKQFGGAAAGRVLVDNAGRPVAIVEMADVRLRACRAELTQLLADRAANAPSEAELRSVVSRHLGDAATLESVLQDSQAKAELSGSASHLLAASLSTLPSDFRFDDGSGAEYTPGAVEDAAFRNESVYLMKKSALQFGIEHMHADNAQGELYLTDAINAILQCRDDDGPRFRACLTGSHAPNEVMSYNNPEELLRIEDHFHGERRQSIEDLRRRLGDECVRTVDEWLKRFADPLPVETRDTLKGFYGDQPQLLDEKSAAYRRVLEHFGRQFGDDRHVILVRSPGRINVMGRHIDWQGGRCNLMAVNQEVIMAVSPRNDDQIEARNVDAEHFSDVSISIGERVSQLDWDSWHSVLDSSELVRHLRASAGGWNLYLEAAILRLQIAYRDRLLRGMDMAVQGDIPIAAGISSSSALVVAAAESALALNGIEITPQQFVNFCGEGEWFVGTRGGSADHAAMKYGEKGTINHVSFHEFELLEQIELPEGYVLVVCNSFVQAKKAAGAKEAFNSRVGSYLAGVELVKRKFPQYAPFISFIRDINPQTLRVPLSRIYEILLELPETVTAREVCRTFRDDVESWRALAPHFQNADPESCFPVRGVVMFGISECARSIRAAECLKRRDVAEFGKLMKVSHDGERCFTSRRDGSVEPFAVDISDAALRRLIAALGSKDPERIAAAQLHQQPGAYRCSTKEIDTIVDIAGRTPGVAGAQIAGAGLGGCAMVLVRSDCVAALEQNLIEHYYTPQGLPSGVTTCHPSGGSGLVSIKLGQPAADAPAPLAVATSK